MTKIKLPPLHPAQQGIVDEARRFNVVCCGRRWGKSVVGEDRAVEAALRRLPVAWLSPSYKMLAEVWRDLMRLLQPVLEKSNATERRLDLAGGGCIEMWSVENFNAIRGRKYGRVIIDEAALMANLEEAWQQAIRPTLTDLQGDAWFLSTPKGRNFFWQCFQRGEDAAQQDWACWQMPTTSNPYIIPEEVEAARLELPERAFAQEYLATFLDDGGGVFRHIRQVATAEPQERALEGHQYVVGVDWARSNDFSAFAVIDVKTKELVALDRFNQVEYAVQSQRLMALCERFRPVVVLAESNAMGAPIIEQLRRQGLPVRPFWTSNTTKAEIIDRLSLAFERGTVQILDDPVLLAELQAYETERLPSGLIRYTAPPGQHDDTVMALALAYHAGESSWTGQLEVFWERVS